MCKSKGGLTRHANTKHKNSDNNTNGTIDIIDENSLTNLVKETTEKLSEDPCYPEELRSKFLSYTDTGKCSSLLILHVQKLLKELSSKGDAETYFGNYYTAIVFKAESFFPGLEKPLSTLLAKRLGDKLLSLFKNPTLGPVNKPIEINQKELGSLQYLGGYVKKMLRKIRNCQDYKSHESQGMISALECMTVDNLEQQRLIKATSRGGLTTINQQTQIIFQIVEEQYRIETSRENLRKIDTRKITQAMMKNVDVNDAYSNILTQASVGMGKEARKNLLEKLISLYLRIRSFSTARDIIDKHRVEQKKPKSKGLRRSIKELAEENNFYKLPGPGK